MKKTFGNVTITIPSFVFTGKVRSRFDDSAKALGKPSVPKGKSNSGSLSVSISKKDCEVGFFSCPAAERNEGRKGFRFGWGGARPSGLRGWGEGGRVGASLLGERRAAVGCLVSFLPCGRGEREKR